MAEMNERLTLLRALAWWRCCFLRAGKKRYSDDVDASPQRVQHFRTRRADRRHRQHAKYQLYKLGSLPAPTILVRVSSTHRHSHIAIPPRPRSTQLRRQLLQHVLNCFSCVQLPSHAPHAIMTH